MAIMAQVKFNFEELTESLTIKISMPKAFGPRMWIVGRMIRFAAFISPVKVEAKLIDADEV